MPDSKRKCLFCDKEFVPKHSPTQKFCSRSCWRSYQKHSYWDLQQERITLTCAWCGEEFKRIPSKVRARHNHYCSRKCTILATSEFARKMPDVLDNPIYYIKICENCGKQYTVEKPRDIGIQRYCSMQCASKAHKPKMLGTNNPNYKHGRSRASARHVALHYFSHKCMICNWDIAVEIHHISPRGQGGRNQLTNLVVLCPNHHRMADLGMISAEELSAIVSRAIKNLPKHLQE